MSKYIVCPVDDHHCALKECLERPSYPRCERVASGVALNILRRAEKNNIDPTKDAPAFISLALLRIKDSAKELEVDNDLFGQWVTEKLEESLRRIKK